MSVKYRACCRLSKFFSCPQLAPTQPRVKPTELLGCHACRKAMKERYAGTPCRNGSYQHLERESVSRLVYCLERDSDQIRAMCVNMAERLSRTWRK